MMNLYIVGVLLVMGFTNITTKDEPDTWGNAFKHLVMWLLSWFAMGLILGAIYKEWAESK